MKTYNDFINESTVKEDEYNLAAAGVGAKSKGAFRNLAFSWDVANNGNSAEKISVSTHVSKSRTSKKKTTLHVTSGYSTWFKEGSVSSGFDNVKDIVKNAEAIKSSLSGKDVASVNEFLKAQGWKKL